MTQPPPDPFGQPVQPGPTSPVGPPQAYPPHPGAMPYPGPPGYPPALPPRGGTPESSRTKAVWALVLALLPLCLTWIAAAVLAIMVLAGPRDGLKRGRGMAWSALVVVVLWVMGSIVAAVVIIASIPADRDDDGTITSGGEVFAEDLRVGDCIDEDFDELFGETDDLVLTLTVRPCDESHTGEVYHEVELDPGSFPGDSSVMDSAEDACFGQFEAWVGQSYDLSELDYTYFYPTEETWATDDRLISCIVVSPDEVTGTLEGSGR